MEDKPCILIADDQESSRLILRDILAENYDVVAFGNGQEVWDYVSAGRLVDLVLLDVVMPLMDGFEVCRRLKENPDTSHIPVLFLTSLDSAADESTGLLIGAEDFIHKPVSPPVVLARVRNHLLLSQTSQELRERNEGLERLVEERTHLVRSQAKELVLRKQDLISAQGAIINAFCMLAEVRDYETGKHILRTQHYVKFLAQTLQKNPRLAPQLPDEVVDILFKSAPLHDIGKIAIPDAILLKPGKLTPDEMEIMKRHCEYGRLAIQAAEREMGEKEFSFLLRYAREIAYSHHERWDGTGYPERLAGEAIPLSARLMAVADVYDALVSKRVYKSPFPHDEAISIMAQERGRQFARACWMRFWIVPKSSGTLPKITGMIWRKPACSESCFSLRGTRGVKARRREGDSTFYPSHGKISAQAPDPASLSSLQKPDGRDSPPQIKLKIVKIKRRNRKNLYLSDICKLFLKQG